MKIHFAFKRSESSDKDAIKSIGGIFKEHESKSHHHGEDYSICL